MRNRSRVRPDRVGPDHQLADQINHLVRVEKRVVREVTLELPGEVVDDLRRPREILRHASRMEPRQAIGPSLRLARSSYFGPFYHRRFQLVEEFDGNRKLPRPGRDETGNRRRSEPPERPDRQRNMSAWSDLGAVAMGVTKVARNQKSNRVSRNVKPGGRLERADQFDE